MIKVTRIDTRREVKDLMLFYSECEGRTAIEDRVEALEANCSQLTTLRELQEYFTTEERESIISPLPA